MSYSAFVCALSSCHFGGSKEKVAVKATPLSPLQPHGSILKWGQMTHEPRVHLCLALASSLFSFYSSLAHIHSDGGVLWREKSTLWLTLSKSFALWCKKGRETLLSAFKKCHVGAASVLSDNQTLLTTFLTYTSQTVKKKMCQIVAVVFPCPVFLFRYWSSEDVTTVAH